jgi:hypothetical protein
MDSREAPTHRSAVLARLDRLAGGLAATLKALSVAFLASYFVLVLLQVFYRYVINESLFWAEELVRGLNSLGVGPRDLISILQAIKAAGALQADLELR